MNTGLWDMGPRVRGDDDAEAISRIAL